MSSNQNYKKQGDLPTRTGGLPICRCRRCAGCVVWLHEKGQLPGGTFFRVYRHPCSSGVWFSFADYQKPYDDNPKYNLAMASYGMVQMLGAGKTYPDMTWEPRLVFRAMSQLK